MGISIIVICVVSFVLWMWYEIKHPMGAEDDHDDAVEFREKSKRKV